MLISKGICFGKNSKGKVRVVRFNDLTIDDPIISENKLEKALVQAKWFNGVSNFNKK